MKRKSLTILVSTIIGFFVFFRRQVDIANSLLVFGKPGNKEFRIFLTDHGGKGMKSFWHDVPVFPTPMDTKVVNMVVEIPRLSRAKMEIHKSEPFNPLFQDERNGKLRYLHSPLSWHYGSVSQTLGDDGDPLDILDISDFDRQLGDIVQLKIFGALPLLDGDHMDWKIVGIAVDDPLANLMDSFEDVDRVKPGVISGITEFFRWYDFPDTRQPNEFAGSALDLDKTISLVQDAHKLWAKSWLSDRAR